MGVERSRGWDIRDAVIVAGVVVGVVFFLIELTGSDIDTEAAKTLGTALAAILFTIFGSAGFALARWQPRFAPFGAVTATLALLAGGATVVSIWGEGFFLFGYGFYATSGKVGGITDLLAIAASASCVLLATVRPDEGNRIRLVRLVTLGALALFIALVVATIVDPDIDIGPRVYAILATVYVVATAVLLALRLLPVEGDSPAAS
jgi:hypothetical protein